MIASYEKQLQELRDRMAQMAKDHAEALAAQKKALEEAAAKAQARGPLHAPHHAAGPACAPPASPLAFAPLPRPWRPPDGPSSPPSARRPRPSPPFRRSSSPSSPPPPPSSAPSSSRTSRWPSRTSARPSRRTRRVLSACRLGAPAGSFREKETSWPSPAAASPTHSAVVASLPVRSLAGNYVSSPLTPRPPLVNQIDPYRPRPWPSSRRASAPSSRRR